jgi:citrate lyase alpha subunit
MAFRAAGALSFSDASIFQEALVMEPASSDSSAAACLSDFWAQLMGFRIPATVLSVLSCCVPRPRLDMLISAETAGCIMGLGPVLLYLHLHTVPLM